MVEFSIVCPIKDEVDLIPKTLPSYYVINASEVILCVDKPAPPGVVEMINKVARACNAEHRTRIIEVEHNPDYRFHQAYVRRNGFLRAKYDKVLTTDIDIVIDRYIEKYFSLLDVNTKLVSFAKLSYPPNFRFIITRLIHKVYKLIRHKTYESFTGLYLFSKKAWIETEDTESLKKIPRGEDTHLHEYLRRKYKTVFIDDVKNICLRPSETKRYQYLIGVTKWRVRRDSLWKVILHSVLYFRPHVLAGYLKAKRAE